ncbi:hypothetical protein BRADI_1g23836v3 [Brachypodium distachyon]|uniref:Ubiquitin-like domain-containing protein n=1 Tax=Brachypodium distachyon TaxID=15368 RepID=A0A0Q3GX22_BRADI|nr:hypothetical protein BRADI_1g23836v3 [Brachypodium distachyon]
MSSLSTTTAARGVKREREDGGRIRIKVQDLNGSRIYYTMRKTDKLQNLFDFYYRSMADLDLNTGRFVLDGKRMQGWQTPSGFNMEDGDEVDFFTQCLGGAQRSV